MFFLCIRISFHCEGGCHDRSYLFCTLGYSACFQGFMCPLQGMHKPITTRQHAHNSVVRDRSLLLHRQTLSCRGSITTTHKTK